MEDRGTALRLTPVSRETLTRLDAFIELLLKWQTKTNLVAPSTLPNIWTRHVADSLQLMRLAPAARTWLDIGSGGGFPGIVIACGFADRAETEVHMVERNAKKAAFLREALRVTGGAGQVHLGDIADCASRLPPAIDVVTARAVAPLSELLSMAAPWIARGAKGLFPKGLDVGQELQSIPTSGMYTVSCHESATGNGRIVEVVQNPADKILA